MSTQSWNVDVDGVMRQIVAETDAESRRTAIRVDGRIAARPMAAEEDERMFNIGSVAYVMRRLIDGQLDLDLAPPQFQPKRTAPPATPYPQQQQRAHTGAGTTRVPQTKTKSGGFPIFKVIFGVMFAFVLLGAGAYVAKSMKYTHVPWRSYTHEDNRFKINFVGTPTRSTEFISTPAGVLRTVQLKSKYAEHHYVVEYIDLPVLISAEREGPFLEEVLKDIVGKDRLVKSEWSGSALTFITEVSKKKDWSEGTMRGKVLVGGKRLYIVYAFVPRGDAVSWDIGEFLRSLEIG